MSFTKLVFKAFYEILMPSSCLPCISNKTLEISLNIFFIYTKNYTQHDK